MVSWRRPPTFMPCTPWSQPLMTWPTPSWNCSGVPRFQLTRRTPRRWRRPRPRSGRRRVARPCADRAVALPDVLDLQVRRRLAAREVDLGLLDAHVSAPAFVVRVNAHSLTVPSTEPPGCRRRRPAWSPWPGSLPAGLVAVAHVRRHDDEDAAADLLARQALRPALDDAAASGKATGAARWRTCGRTPCRPSTARPCTARATVSPAVDLRAVALDDVVRDELGRARRLLGAR